MDEISYSSRRCGWGGGGGERSQRPSFRAVPRGAKCGGRELRRAGPAKLTAARVCRLRAGLPERSAKPGETPHVGRQTAAADINIVAQSRERD